MAATKLDRSASTAKPPLFEVTMNKLYFALAMAALIQSSASLAKARFETYEARNSIVDGNGGSRTAKDGIDFWTIGDPPRRYQIIGIIRDKRGTGVFHGNALASSKIAKMVREAGGDAVILLDENTTLKGVLSRGSGFAIPIQQRTTTLAVVKYLERPASQ